MRFPLLAALALIAAPSSHAHAAALTPALADEGCIALFDAKCGPPLTPMVIDLLPLQVAPVPSPEPPPFVWLQSEPEARGTLVAAQLLQNPVEQDPYLPPTDALLRAGWALALLMAGWGVFRVLLR